MRRGYIMSFNSIIQILRRHWFLLLYRFYKVDSKSIFFYPHPNCQVDKYDVIRYHSDNALCLFNFLLRDSRYNTFRMVIAVYNEEAIDTYIKYCYSINPAVSVSFVSIKDPRIIKMAAGCGLYFTDTTAHSTLFKKKSNQTVVDLGYFVPFKNIYINDPQKRKKSNKKIDIIDYTLTTADLPARILALSYGFPLENVLTLGLCRNDIFYNKSSLLKQDLEDCLNRKINHLILYVPTWRNYEYRNGAKNNVYTRSLFGYDDSYTDWINDLLGAHNSVLIAKLHPLQCNVNVRGSIRDNILLYNDIENLLN